MWLLHDIVLLIYDFMRDKESYTGSPTELSTLLSVQSGVQISSRLFVKTHQVEPFEELRKRFIHVDFKRAMANAVFLFLL